MTSYITATFKTRPAAEQTLMELEKIGITDEQIGLIISDETRGSTFNMEESNKTEEGFTAGATTGGVVGTIIGALSTATAMAIPGVNIVVSGVVVSMLAGLGAGATTGGLVGALAGAGITEHEAKVLEDEVKNGSILIAVKPENDDQKEKIKETLERQDAYNLAA